MSFTRFMIKIEAPAEWLFATINDEDFQKICIISIATRAKDLIRKTLDSEGSTVINYKGVKAEIIETPSG